ncbi:hypothetical protein NPX13_g264 [Xylaria arbuscula]|uniref:Uncharacterized protein n=1 Tax=Xylaria arbuscula TaxID=114810 RepID=A0A9W8NP72_9PEZI|nr:hypothetical protein NPX13_g264 [Xylaria arbuscula]
MAFQVPEVSPADIESFHSTHFSNDAINIFHSQFLRPDSLPDCHVEDYYYEEEEEEDDGLGYYPDGVKRTLTDEQIAIFRHSELEALRRAERTTSKQQATHDEESAIEPSSKDPVHTPMNTGDSHTNSDAIDDVDEGSEDGEIETEKPVLTKAEMRRQKKLRARQRKRENQKFQPEKKPDLRKRTWDVVEAGMDGLYYDDLGTSQNSNSASSAQRKQISYDD